VRYRVGQANATCNKHRAKSIRATEDKIWRNISDLIRKPQKYKTYNARSRIVDKRLKFIDACQGAS
jgi:hypothetical protein